MWKKKKPFDPRQYDSYDPPPAPRAGLRDNVSSGFNTLVKKRDERKQYQKTATKEYKQYAKDKDSTVKELRGGAKALTNSLFFGRR